MVILKHLPQLIQILNILQVTIDDVLSHMLAMYHSMH